MSDCTNEGITSEKTNFILTDEENPPAEVNGTPVLKVVRRMIGREEYIHAEPVAQPKGLVGPMAGGNFVYSTDSRFRDQICSYPISVHDRWETARQYRENSI
jgi:hypothetical protein